jgi:hypothetical protein
MSICVCMYTHVCARVFVVACFEVGVEFGCFSRKIRLPAELTSAGLNHGPFSSPENYLAKALDNLLNIIQLEGAGQLHAESGHVCFPLAKHARVTTLLRDWDWFGYAIQEEVYVLFFLYRSGAFDASLRREYQYRGG